MIGLVRPTGLIISMAECMAECYTGGDVLIRILITLRSILRDIGFSGSIRLNLLRLMQLIYAINFEPCLNQPAYVVVERWTATTMLLA